MSKRVAVVGAGLAGLAASWALSRAGIDVTVFEARSVAGGRVRSAELDGVRFDPGVQLLGSNYRETFRLGAAVGAQHLFARSPGRDAVWRRGRAQVLTYGSVASMITSSALPTSLKLKLGARYLPYLARHAASLDLHDLLATGGLDHDQESIGEWGERELGRDFVELMVYPLLGAYYGSTPESSSSAVYHALARVGLDVSVHAVRGGMGELPAAITAWLQQRGVQFRFGAAVERVSHDPPAVDQEAFDAVLIATTAAAAGRLLAISSLQEWTSQVRMTATATLALVIKGRLNADYFGLSVPRRAGEASKVVAFCVQERKLEGLVPPDHSVLVVLPAPEHSAELTQRAPEEVLDDLLPAVEHVFPGVRSRITRARTTAFAEAYTVFYPGYLRHLQRFRAIALPAGIALAGDYLVAPTVEGAVRSGLAAARRLQA